MPAEQAELDAARLLLSKMGISPADLVAEPAERKPIPTFSEYLPAVQRAVSAATARAYASYWRRLEEQITKRRYDHLWNRLGRHIPSVRTQNISTHWLRHTTLTWVERHFGYATAHAFAGHADASDSATITYIKADLTDIATALQTLTGEPHPLARQVMTAPAGGPVSLAGKAVRA